MPDLVMPRLSDSMEEGVVLSWLKSEGEAVEVGEELVEIETDKANMTYESDLAGTLVKIVASEGDTIPVGGRIAIVGEPGEEAEEAEAGAGAEEEPAAGATTGDGRATEEQPEPATAQAPSGGPAAPAGGTEDGGEKGEAAPATTAVPPGGDGADGNGRRRIKASPLARRMASDRGLELSALSGSGPGGRIIRADVEAAGEAAEKVAEPSEAAAPAAEPAGAPAGAARDVASAKGESELVEPNRLQQTIARRMAESKATAPHFYLTTEADMSACVKARSSVKESAREGAVIPSFNDMIVKASALALRENPMANASYRDGKFELHSRVNVGVAVAAHEALVVPTVFDADGKGLAAIARESRDLAARVRDQTITPPELSGATFTVSNLGMYGITEFDAVINTPQAAILAVGSIDERPVVRDGEITTAHLMKMTLSCDHRILYGAEGADFLARIRELLEEPLGLAL